jgi:hypothetical protein
MSDIKFNYKLNIKGVMMVDDDNINIAIEDDGEYALAHLCKDFDDKLVKISIAYDEDYGANAVEVDEETGEVN